MVLAKPKPHSHQQDNLVSASDGERLEERKLLEWQVVAGIADGELLVERPTSTPHPSIEVLQFLPDGTEVKAVWSYLADAEAAQLVTVHFFDEGF